MSIQLQITVSCYNWLSWSLTARCLANIVELIKVAGAHHAVLARLPTVYSSPKPSLRALFLWPWERMASPTSALRRTTLVGHFWRLKSTINAGFHRFCLSVDAKVAYFRFVDGLICLQRRLAYRLAGVNLIRNPQEFCQFASRITSVLVRHFYRK